MSCTSIRKFIIFFKEALYKQHNSGIAAAMVLSSNCAPSFYEKQPSRDQRPEGARPEPLTERLMLGNFLISAKANGDPDQRFDKNEKVILPLCPQWPGTSPVTPGFN